MRIISLKIILFLAINGLSQNFTHSLSIMSKQDGLQALAVSPELKNIANTGFNDVRLYDQNKNEVPYFLVNESFNYSSSRFKEHKISDKEIGKGRRSSFIVNNPDKKNIRNIVMCIANSDAFKFCNITGSDDKKQWYSVSDHIFMYHLYDHDSVIAYRTIHFPVVNYKFIKIEINDLFTKPLNILKAGYFEGAISAGKLNEIKPSAWNYNTNKEKKKSTLVFKFEHPNIVNNLSFKIKSPNYYRRKANISVARKRTVKQKEEIYREVLLNFELNSETNNNFNLSNFREKEFEIEIFNDDNPPLEFETISLKQLQSYLVADFKKGEEYTLQAGNKKLAAPVYDIEHFRNKISQYLPTLEVSDLKKIPPQVSEVEVAEPLKIWQEPWFMWMCIALASFILFIFSVKVLRDIRK